MNIHLTRRSLYKALPLLIWFLLLVLPFLTQPVSTPNAFHRRFLINIVISNTVLLIFFYAHTYLVYPLFLKRGFWVYLAGLAGLIFVYLAYWKIFRKPPDMHDMPKGPGFGPPGDFPGRPSPFNPRFDRPMNIMPLFSLAIALLCSYCYRIILDNTEREQKLKERETAHLKTELDFLRSQINPHFLFNVLNSLTSLARKRSDRLEFAIVNLSQLMRYMLYESDGETVALTREVEYLDSYIQLQLLRSGDEVSVVNNMTGNYTGYSIEPMLLISLLENAFKHGAKEGNPCVIEINLSIRDSNTLYFSVQNNVSAKQSNSQLPKGIGIKNLNRRLDILYPERHVLTFTTTSTSFLAELTIQLNDLIQLKS